jgi:hypothetical protein
MFAVPLRPYPGKAVVIMLPFETMQPRAEFEFQGRKVKLELPDSFLYVHPDGRSKADGRVVGSRQQADVGIVARFTPERDSKGRIINAHQEQIREGMIVGVRPYAGSWFGHAELPWIPQGRRIVILGKYGIEGDVLCEIEFSQGEAA